MDIKRLPNHTAALVVVVLIQLAAVFPSAAAPGPIPESSPIDTDSIVSRNGRYVLINPGYLGDEILYKDGKKVLSMAETFPELYDLSRSSLADSRSLWVGDSGRIVRAMKSADYTVIRLAIIDTAARSILADSQVEHPSGLWWKDMLGDVKTFRLNEEQALVGIAISDRETSSMQGFALAWIKGSSIGWNLLLSQNPENAPAFSARNLDPWFLAAETSAAAIVRTTQAGVYWSVSPAGVIEPYNLPAAVSSKSGYFYLGADKQLYLVDNRFLASKKSGAWRRLFRSRHSLASEQVLDVFRGAILQPDRIVSKQGIIGSQFACRFPNSATIGRTRFEEIQALQFTPSGEVFGRFKLKLPNEQYSAGVLPLTALTSNINYCAKNVSVTLGGECGQIDKQFHDGQTWNNFLSNSECRVSGSARGADGLSLAGADAVVLLNDEIVARTRSDRAGRFSFPKFRISTTQTGDRLLVIVPYNHPVIRGAEVTVYTADHLE
jgi:hypothetical protein